jgi:hypothetical protein
MVYDAVRLDLSEEFSAHGCPQEELVITNCHGVVFQKTSTFINKVKQSRYRPGVAQRVPGS